LSNLARPAESPRLEAVQVVQHLVLQEPVPVFQVLDPQGCALETDLRLPGAIVEDGSARSPGDDLNRLRRAR